TRSPEPEIAEQMRRSFFEQMQRWTAEGYSLQVFCSNDGEKQRFEELWREHRESVVRGSPDPAQSSTEGLQNSARSGDLRRTTLKVSIATLSRGLLWTDAKLAVV